MRRRDDRGSAAVELLAVVPLFVLVLLFTVQVFAFIYTAQSASQAARDGAREYSRTGSLSAGEAAVRASLPSSVELVSVQSRGPGHGVRVTVRSPHIVRLAEPELTRTVVMP